MQLFWSFAENFLLKYASQISLSAMTEKKNHITFHAVHRETFQLCLDFFEYHFGALIPMN